MLEQALKMENGGIVDTGISNKVEVVVGEGKKRVPRKNE